MVGVANSQDAGQLPSVPAGLAAGAKLPLKRRQRHRVLPLSGHTLLRADAEQVLARGLCGRRGPHKGEARGQVDPHQVVESDLARIVPTGHAATLRSLLHVQGPSAAPLCGHSQMPSKTERLVDPIRTTDTGGGAPVVPQVPGKSDGQASVMAPVLIFFQGRNRERSVVMPVAARVTFIFS